MHEKPNDKNCQKKLMQELDNKLVVLLKERKPGQELEVRFRCTSQHASKILRHLKSYSKWTRVHHETHQDVISKSLRKRTDEDGTEHVTNKVMVEKADFVIHGSALGSGISARAILSNEHKATWSNNQMITQIRFSERHTFVHQGYISFDITTSVSTSADDYHKQIPAQVSNEIEIELIAEKYQGEGALLLHAQSLRMKLVDMVRAAFGNIDDVYCQFKQ